MDKPISLCVMYSTPYYSPAYNAGNISGVYANGRPTQKSSKKPELTSPQTRTRLHESYY